MIDIIKQYKDLRYIIKQLRWGIKLDRVDGISPEDCELQTEICKTAKELIFKHCSWYYKYKKLFYDYPGVNSPTFIKL